MMLASFAGIQYRYILSLVLIYCVRDRFGRDHIGRNTSLQKKSRGSHAHAFAENGLCTGFLDCIYRHALSMDMFPEVVIDNKYFSCFVVE